MSLLRTVALGLLLIPMPNRGGPAGPAHPIRETPAPAPAGETEEQVVEGGDPDEGATIDIVVEKPRPDWLFPKLDHPRVQAFFRNDAMTGSSLFDPEPPPPPVPLVRAGRLEVQGAASPAQRRAARRFARRLVADRRDALEACYVDALQRSAGDAVKLTFSIEVQNGSRSAFHLDRGQLGDTFGNACVMGVLEFAPAQIEGRDRAEALRAHTVKIDIPVWFWLQSQTVPG
ncbi:hypothetical protein [Plesiocystis pacifica]|nr:hypothetical protein [Plesiocystis pacifica]